jgi:hypothetical protein
MGNAFNISHTVFHITVTLNSILVIRWSSSLISRVDLALKNGINVITPHLPTPQKSLFLHGSLSDSESFNFPRSAIYVVVVPLNAVIRGPAGMKRETNNDSAIVNSLAHKKKSA